MRQKEQVEKMEEMTNQIGRKGWDSMKDKNMSDEVMEVHKGVKAESKEGGRKPREDRGGATTIKIEAKMVLQAG